MQRAKLSLEEQVNGNELVLLLPAFSANGDENEL